MRLAKHPKYDVFQFKDVTNKKIFVEKALRMPPRERVASFYLEKKSDGYSKEDRIPSAFCCLKCKEFNSIWDWFVVHIDKDHFMSVDSKAIMCPSCYHIYYLNWLGRYHINLIISRSWDMPEEVRAYYDMEDELRKVDTGIKFR